MLAVLPRSSRVAIRHRAGAPHGPVIALVSSRALRLGMTPLANSLATWDRVVCVFNPRADLAFRGWREFSPPSRPRDEDLRFLLFSPPSARHGCETRRCDDSLHS